MEPGRRRKLVNLAVTALVLVAVGVAVVALATMDPAGKRGPKTGRRYSDAVRQAAAVAPAAVSWEEAPTPIALDVPEPCGLAVDAEGRIFVAGTCLLVLEPDGRVRARSADFPEPARAVAVAPDGRIFLVAGRAVTMRSGLASLDEVADRWEIAEDGTDLLAVAVTPQGVFVADAGGYRVLRLREEPTWGQPRYQVFADGFHVPSDFELASAPDGELATVDPGRHQVQIRSSYGDVVRSFGQMGDELADFHGCCNPAAIAFLPDGRVVTAEKGLAATRVKVYTPDGKLSGVVAGPQSFDHRPDGPPIVLDLAVDARGRILVLDPSRRQVRIFMAAAPGKEGGR